MIRDYLPNGTKYTASADQKALLNQAIAKLKWIDIASFKPNDLAFGYGLGKMVMQFGQKVDYVGECGHGSPMRYALLAIRNNYNAGEFRRVTLFAIDIGDIVVPLAVDKETAEDLLRPENDRPTLVKTSIHHI